MTKPASTKAAKAETPWGRAVVLEEAKVAQRAGDRRFTSVVQLLETDAGEQLVRFAYMGEGSIRRGTVTLRRRDLERVRGSLKAGSALASAFGWGQT